MRAFFEWNGGGPTFKGKLRLKARLVKEGIKCQNTSSEPIGSWVSTMFCGGGFLSSMSSEARLRKTPLLLPLISSSPSRSIDIRAMSRVLLWRIRSASSIVICTVPSMEPPPTKIPADKSKPSSILGCRCDGNSKSSFESGSRMNVREGIRRWVSCEIGSSLAAM